MKTCIITFCIPIKLFFPEDFEKKKFSPKKVQTVKLNINPATATFQQQYNHRRLNVQI